MAANLRVRPRPPRRDQLFFGLFVGTAGATNTNPLTFSGALAINQPHFIHFRLGLLYTPTKGPRAEQTSLQSCCNWCLGTVQKATQGLEFLSGVNEHL